MAEIEKKNEDAHIEDSIPFYPDHVLTEFRVVVGLMVLVVIVAVLGLVFPVGLGDPADPMNTPAHVKPEWYFLALYQVLKFVPETVGVLIPFVAIGLVLLWPFLDRKPDTSRRAQLIRLIFTLVALIVLVALTIWGELS